MKIIKRIASILMVIILVALFVALLVFGITGSEYFPVALLLCVIIPVLFYGISLMTRILGDKGKELEKEALDAQKENKSEMPDAKSNNVEK